ncbi:rhamnogalacturonan lyase [Streptomyces sp. 3MP-14]|uniref:Rhamnogalacturonan lyase n=1 Tax=Streptomyces mimosae TaxID=2586635 RepID=A0A5N6AGB6_9ACTN|nr:MULTISPECIES: rhamnogalacturonan lyase [Streptomyces]KAB8167691.1 rhamnogalacturonan lyase [Streptomyces mimosae]KAB8177662.1 rhamnogalacturonan lyase [Streptomyces sp. 3MP-14]
MRHTRRARRLATAALASLLTATTLLGGAPGAAGGERPGRGGPELEVLDRGLVAVASGEGVFLSWRLLGQEADGHSETGLTGVDFRVYRDGRPIATVTDSTNFLDPDGTTDSSYRVAALVDGREQRASGAVAAAGEGFHEIPLQRPEGGVTPAGEEYTYSANDMSVGDVDGDGAYEFVVKWDPSNSKDVSQVGYTGNVYLDTYELDGTLLHRVDLGVNVRAGAHYTQFLVYDFDGNGRAEIMFKTAPGTTITRYNDRGRPTSTRPITLPREDIRAGIRHSDDYRLSAADYYQHLVGMFQGWSDHPEVTAGNWPATIEEALGTEPTYDYPLNQADAEALADYFIDTYAPARSERNQLRAFEGFILDGPEYLTVIDGHTGRERDTVRYWPDRDDDGLLWGDYAMPRIEPGNRVDRFLATVAYLDGHTPAAVFARGYYTRTTLAAYHYDGHRIHTQWTIDSGHTPMTNPFNDSPHGRDGTHPTYGTLTTQGFHSLSSADIDHDGRQEIIYGSATLDDNGDLLYSSTAPLPPQAPNPGQPAKLGHGDAMHITDIDPTNPGLEIFTSHEGGTSAPFGYALRDAETGEVLFGGYTGVDTARAMVGEIDPDLPGLEVWANSAEDPTADPVGLWSASGEPIDGENPAANQSVRWAGDLTTQQMRGATTEEYVVPTIEDWRRGTLLTAEGTTTNNWWKGNPSLVADIHGDWREEVLLPTVDSSAIRIYTSTEVTDHKLYTLMHDPQYRVEVARQQTTYNQPSHPSFYLATDMDWANVPLPGRR